MAIYLKDIINRKYDSNRYPVVFEYVIQNLQGPHGETQEMRVWFEKVKPEVYGLDINRPTYEVYTFIDDTVYRKIYQMPKSGMPLNLIVATGLNILRFTFQEQAAYREMLSYTIADITKDM